MNPALVIARPYFTLRVPASEWQAAPPPEGADVKLVSPDGQHTLMLLVLVAPYDKNDPAARATAFGRLTHVYGNYRQSNASLGAHTVVDDTPPDDEPGTTWNAGFTLDFGGTVLRRHFRSELYCPALFGERGQSQVMVNVALYTEHAGRADGPRRFEEALAGLDVAPAAFSAGLSGPAANHLSPPPPEVDDEDDEDDEPPEPADPRTFLPWIVTRAWLAQFARVLPVWGVSDPTEGMTPLGHDLFVTVARPARDMPTVLQVLLLPGPELVSTAFDNIARRGDELIGQRHFTPRGQPVLVIHGNRSAATFTLLAMFQSSFAETLGARQLLACFLRPDLAGVFADGPADLREDARRFLVAGAGEITLSDELFALTGVGGARPV